MKTLKTIYHGFCMVEETIVAAFVAAITFLAFFSALARSAGYFITWPLDMSLLLLSWVAFLGADTALRRADFIRVDILVSRFPLKVQKFLYYLYYAVIILFLLIVIRFGIPLSLENIKRNFQGMAISYSWATISAPVGSILMIITILRKLKKRWNKETESEETESKEAEDIEAENKEAI